MIYIIKLYNTIEKNNVLRKGPGKALIKFHIYRVEKGIEVLYQSIHT